MWFDEMEAFVDDLSSSSTESQEDDDLFSEFDEALLNEESSGVESQDDDDGLLLSNREVYLSTSRLNEMNMNDRVEAIVRMLGSVDMKGLLLDEAPADDEFGRTVSQAILLNRHFTSIVFWPDDDVTVRDLIPWISCHGTTLVHLRSLVKVDITGAEHLSMQDWDFLFSLLRTSMSLKELEIHFLDKNWREDAVVSAITRFLGGSFLTTFKYTCSHQFSFSAVPFAFLCDAIAESSLRELTLPYFDVAHVEMAAECLARAIVPSSLEQLNVKSLMIGSLTRTRPVRDLDFSFDCNDAFESSLTINRKWKPLLSANVPLGLWPHILKKAHASPEFSHGPVGILFILLKEKCDLVPLATS